MEKLNQFIISEVIPIVFEINKKNKFVANIELSKNFVMLTIFQRGKVIELSHVYSFSKFEDLQNTLNLVKKYNRN